MALPCGVMMGVKLASETCTLGGTTGMFISRHSEMYFTTFSGLLVSEGLTVALLLEGGAVLGVALQADREEWEEVTAALAVVAVRAEAGAVEVGWETRNGQLDVWVRDEGAGLADTANLFVPFYTTKPDGSGIGLALSRHLVGRTW